MRNGSDSELGVYVLAPFRCDACRSYLAFCVETIMHLKAEMARETEPS